MLINVLAILFGIGWALLTAVLAARREPKPVSLSTVFVTGAIVGFGAGLAALVVAIPRDGMFAAVHIAYVAATLGPAVLADIQTPTITNYERDALQRVMDANPDLIVIAGDIQQSSDFFGELENFREFFASAQAPFGVYVVQGDVESLGDMRELVAGTGVTYLENEIVEIAIGDRVVRLGGNQRAWKHSDPQAMFAELGEAPAEVVTVVLTHRPDVVFDLRGSVDIVIAGHTHGGQVALPFIGPPVTKSDVPRSVGAGGLHVVDEQTIYLSSGVGLERGDAPQVRFLAPPSVGIVTLQSAQSCG